MSSLTEKMKIFLGFQEEPESSPMSQQPQRPLQRESALGTRGFRGSLVHNTQARLGGLEIKVIEPRVYEDSLTIASNLRDNKPVIVNLKYLDAPTGKRLVDFICGTAYAINGHMLKIGEHIFLFTPENVMIADSQSDKTELEQTIAHSQEKDSFFKQAAL